VRLSCGFGAVGVRGCAGVARFPGGFRSINAKTAKGAKGDLGRDRTHRTQRVWFPNRMSKSVGGAGVSVASFRWWSSFA
jgi:hypothetical protein